MGWPVLSNLRVRLMLLVLIAVIPAAVMIVWTNLEQRRDERADAQTLLRQVTEAAATQEAQLLQSGRELLGHVAVAPQVTGGDLTACREYLAGVSAIEPRYRGFAVADLDGNVVCTDVDAQGVNVADRSYFQRVVAGGQFAVGDFALARTEDATPVLPVAYPVFDQGGELSGVLVAGIRLDWLGEFSARLTLPAGAALTVFDRHGVILARHPNPEAWVGKSVQEAPLLEAVLAQGEGTTEVPGLDGVNRLYAFTPLVGGAEPGAYLSVGVSTDAVFAGADRTLARNLLLLGAAAALALAAAWVVGDLFVLRSVKALVAATQRLARGDLSARTALPHHGGELNQLARSFDEMAETLQRREAERSEAEQALRDGEVRLQQMVADLARSNTELEQFAYVASHDLQEPLRMVASYTQLLARRYQDRLDADANEFIGFAVDGAKRMQALINDLLALSRVSTRGREAGPVDCDAVVERSLANLKVAIEESGAQVSRDRLPAVLADPVQLEQVFQNLIGNAIKFRGAGPPRVHISAEQRDGEWLISVRDNGIGINPEYQERIFVIFQRLHAKETYPGTGIGLAVCKKIVERHGGRIWVESQSGEGATFSFTLKAAPDLVRARPRAERRVAAQRA